MSDKYQMISAENMDKNTINSVFDEREKYLIIALTGKVGAGCTAVSNIFEQTFTNMNLACESPGQDGFDDDAKRADRVLLRFYRRHEKTFHIIRVREVIVSFLLQDNAWSRLPINKRKAIESEFFGIASHDERLEKLAEVEDGSKLIKKVQQLYTSAFQKDEKNIEDKDRLNICEYITIVLPELAKCVRKVLGREYTFLFQDFGNELRFFGTLDPEKRAESIKEASNFNAPAKGEKNGSFARSNTIFTIAERINKMIKFLQRPNSGKKKEPIAVVIDSMKNMYESNYLRDRYSAYYLFAVSRDEEIRINNLQKNEKKGLTRNNIDVIDLNERPGEAAKKIIKFCQCYRESLLNLPEEKKNKLSKDTLSDVMKYLNAVCAVDAKALFGDYVLPLGGKDTQWLKSFFCAQNRKVGESDESLFLWKDGTGDKLASRYKDAGLTHDLCEYCFEVLGDPLRVFLYVNKLYPFYLQDVEACIQNADIFLNNNEEDDSPKHKLKMNVLRYVSLMMHPGLLKPTAVERCMQIAYTAKVNSGCISRQVGAVVTDKDYNILSLGWNDIPCGQTQCAYRNLVDLSRQNDRQAYSDYEWKGDGPFQQYLKKYEFERGNLEAVLNGLPASFCFKSINEALTGDKNPMNARSMHGEEKALLQCDQQRVKGGYLFTTSSPCEMCAKNAKEHHISKIYYIEPYPGISQSHICNSGTLDNRAQYELFEGAIGRAYTQLYTPVIPYKDELSLRGFPGMFDTTRSASKPGEAETKKTEQTLQKTGTRGLNICFRPKSSEGSN